MNVERGKSEEAAKGKDGAGAERDREDRKRDRVKNRGGRHMDSERLKRKRKDDIKGNAGRRGRNREEVEG